MSEIKEFMEFDNLDQLGKRINTIIPPPYSETRVSFGNIASLDQLGKHQIGRTAITFVPPSHPENSPLQESKQMAAEAFGQIFPFIDPEADKMTETGLTYWELYQALENPES